MSIQQKLAKVSTLHRKKVFTFYLSPLQFRVMKLVASSFGISKAELIRRAVNLVIANIKDVTLLRRIKNVREAMLEEESADARTLD